MNASGLCECGCGGLAPIAAKTDKRHGSVKGQLQSFINGHNRRGKRGQRKDSNDVRHCLDGTSVIILERRGDSPLECVINTTDYDKVKTFYWVARRSKRTFYAYATQTDGSRVAMHRLLLPDCEEPDHLDHNGLNNRRLLNLRPATHLENRLNQQKHKNGTTSRFIGVCWNKPARKYQASISVNGVDIALGYF